MPSRRTSSASISPPTVAYIHPLSNPISSFSSPPPQSPTSTVPDNASLPSLLEHRYSTTSVFNGVTQADSNSLRHAPSIRSYAPTMTTMNTMATSPYSPSLETGRNSHDGLSIVGLYHPTTIASSAASYTSRGTNTMNASVASRHTYSHPSPSATTLSQFLANAPAAAATTAVRAAHPSARRVRTNLFHTLSQGWNQISRKSKAMLVISVFIVLGEVLSCIVVLSLSTHEVCDKDLRLYLALFLVRVALSAPLAIAQHLYPISMRRNGSVTGGESRQRWRARADRLKSFLDLFAIVWFVVGNYYLFTCENCYVTSPLLYYTTLAWLIYGYLIILIPVLLCLSVIFCLPCVIVMIRMIRVREGIGMVGATEEILENVPIKTYKADKVNASEEERRSEEHQNDPPVQNRDDINSIITLPDSAPTSPSIKEHKISNEESSPIPMHSISNPEPQRQRRSWLGRLTPRRHTSTEIETNATPEGAEEPSEEEREILTLTNPADAVCAICLGDYEDGDSLRQPWCGHHFHQECADAWLRLNRVCPLCKQTVVKEEADKASK